MLLWTRTRLDTYKQPVIFGAYVADCDGDCDSDYDHIMPATGVCSRRPKYVSALCIQAETHRNICLNTVKVKKHRRSNSKYKQCFTVSVDISCLILADRYVGSAT